MNPERLLHKLDELFVHQFVVRRFRLNHVDDFNTLQSLRRELEICLQGVVPDSSEELSLSWQIRTSQLVQCMNHFDVKANLRLVATGSKEVAYENFCEDLYAGGNNNELLPVFTRALADDDDACVALFEILHKYAKQVLEIRERLNFLDYYSPFAMTTCVDGASLYLSYIKAKVGIDKLKPDVDSEISQFPEIHWLFTDGSVTDEELSSFVLTYCYRSNRPSRNIRTIGGNQHTVEINGETFRNCLLFCVPTDEVPDRIDESLSYFRDALVSELYGHYFANQTEIQKFEDSHFMTQFSRTPLLVKNWDHVQKNIVNLWVWDRVNLEGSLIADTPQQVGVYKQIHNEMQTLKHDFEHGFIIYSESTIKKYSEEAASMIGAIKSKDKISPRALDGWRSY